MTGPVVDPAAPPANAAPPVVPAAAPEAPPAPQTLGERLQSTFRGIRDAIASTKEEEKPDPDPNAPPPAAAPVVDPNAPPADPNAPPPAADPNAPPAPIEIELLPAAEGADALTLEVPDEATATRLREVTRLAAHAETLEAQVQHHERDSVERDALMENIAVDPVGFLLETVPQERLLELAMAAFARHGIPDEIGAQLSTWMDGTEDGDLKRQRFAFDLDKRTTENRGRVEQTVRGRMIGREIARTVDRTVGSLVSLAKAEDQRYFQDDCLRDMQELYSRNPRLGVLQKEEIAHILQHRLRQYGIPEQAVQARLNPSQVRLPTAKPTGEAAERLAAQAANAKATGARLVAKAAGRAVVAAVPGAGVGITPPSLTPPAKQSFAERVKWMKTNVLGQKA